MITDLFYLMLELEFHKYYVHCQREIGYGLFWVFIYFLKSF